MQIKNLLKEFINENKAQLKNFNRAIYKDNSKVDKINSEFGLGYFIYDDKYLTKDQILSNKELNQLDLNINTISNKRCFKI